MIFNLQVRDAKDKKLVASEWHNTKKAAIASADTWTQSGRYDTELKRFKDGVEKVYKR